MTPCDELDLRADAMADGTLELSADERAHAAACTACAASLEHARALHAALSMRDQPAPPASFTSGVMARVRRERWRAEQAVDIGFNLAIAAGLLFILAGAIGLAWSAGLLTINMDWRSLVAAAMTQWPDRLLPQMQTVVMAALLLSMTLGVWWWAETDWTV